MDDSKDYVSKKIIDGVEIIEYKDGHTTFNPIEPEKTKVKKESKNWFQKVVDWFKTSKVTPYVKVRDLADPTGDRCKDPFDYDAGSDGKNGVEVGIKINF